MQITKRLSVNLALVVCGGCSAFQMHTLPQTIGVSNEGPAYGYRPLDPLTAKLEHSEKVPVTNCRILELLPDETMRLAIGQVDMSGNISYGLAKAGVQGNRYVVILDYIKSDTRSLLSSAPVSGAPASGRHVPTYVGIGLRLSANLIVNQGNVDLGNLISIGAAAQAKQVSGTLVIQTLGISGESIDAVLPIPSEISTASIQNALVAIGTMKSKIYDDKTSLSPRVVGIYNVFGNDSTAFDAFFASVLDNPPALTERETSSHCAR